MQGAGYLAIWSDLTPQDHTDWAHWITREHAAERVGVNGFLACRIFRAQGLAVNRYFILYELEELSGEAIATLTGLKPATVWVHLHRARARFIAEMKRDSGRST